ncbi:MAG: hypothetical protein RLZZ460_120 [Chloroflexota bacterium]
MSQSETVQHVSDAAWEADARFYGATRDATEQWHADRGTVLRTVAEWQSLVDQLAAKTAECERLHRDLRNADAALADMDERLREGREDEKACDGSHVVGETYSHCPAHPLSTSLVTVADTLDPRLGVQQPEGEPVQPMPYWRRSGV